MKRLAIFVLAAHLLLAAGLPAQRASAAGGVSFTLTVSSAFLRAAPNATAARTYSIFLGQSYDVSARTADNEWISLDYAGATRGTWVRASFGRVDGLLENVPVSDGAPVIPAGITSQGTTITPIAGGAGRTMLLTITASSAFARDVPYAEGSRIASLFRGQEYLATGRDFASNWVRIQMWGGSAWVTAGSVRLAGNLLDLPAVDEVPVSGDATIFGIKPSSPLPSWIPAISTTQRDIYYQAAAFGRSHRIFTVAGDCNSLSYYYLELVAKNLIDLRGENYLRATIQNFKPSFSRLSAAVSGGFNTASILDPTWAEPGLCQAGETPFACELRVSNASIIFIALGTGDQYDWRSFEGNYRQMLTIALQSGVLPVAVTKADNLESQEGGAEPGYINNTIRRLAQEFNVPLLDFELATADLPNHGLVDEPGHDFHLSGEAMGVHVLTTLETLNAIWQP
jgi:hypothetical protein